MINININTANELIRQQQEKLTVYEGIEDKLSDVTEAFKAFAGERIPQCVNEAEQLLETLDEM